MYSSADIRERLVSLSDAPFRDFNSKLIPTVDPDTVIGVKTPLLRAFAKELLRCGEHIHFLRSLPHKYFEENQLHAFIISEIKDFDEAIFEIEKFLPYIDNWATCDQLSVKAFANSPERILPYINMWINSEQTYTVRFAICQLMRYFLDEKFDTVYSDTVVSVRSDEYYVNMMIAWYFATAAAKQYEKILPYFKEQRLSPWVHNKAIQKARESYRVSDEHKAELLRLKIKNC